MNTHYNVNFKKHFLTEWFTFCDNKINIIHTKILDKDNTQKLIQKSLVNHFHMFLMYSPFYLQFNVPFLQESFHYSHNMNVIEVRVSTLLRVGQHPHV